MAKNTFVKYRKCSAIGRMWCCKCFACYLFCWNVVRNVCLSSPPTQNKETKRACTHTQKINWDMQMDTKINCHGLLACFCVRTTHTQIKSKIYHLMSAWKLFVHVKCFTAAAKWLMKLIQSFYMSWHGLWK